MSTQATAGWVGWVTSLTAAPQDAPTATSESATPGLLRRIVALDVLRGIAILGTLAANIGMFAANQAPGPAWHRPIDTAIGLLTDGKYIGLLTIMFGIGLEIQRQSAVRRGDPWLGTYPWRAALLIVDGLLNYIFIFEFDVLMGYGLTGLVMCFVLATTPRVQKWVMGLGLSLHVAYLGYLTWAQTRMLEHQGPKISNPALLDQDPRTMTAAQLSEVALYWNTTEKKYLELWTNPDLSGTGTSDYWDQVHQRLASFWTGGRGEIPIMFTMGLGLFLVGAWLYRAGIFEAAGARLRKTVMLLSFGVGLPIDWITRLWFSDMTGPFNRYLTSSFVSLGLLALVAHFYARGRQRGPVGNVLARVGRMALSCYVLQNLIASIIFYDWGFGLARKWEYGVFNLIFGWALVGAILVAFSTLWLRYIKRGPVEWVWHVSHEWLVRNTTGRMLARRGR